LVFQVLQKKKRKKYIHEAPTQIDGEIEVFNKI